MSKKYLSAPGDVLCLFCGQKGHDYNDCASRLKYQNKNMLYVSSASHAPTSSVPHMLNVNVVSTSTHVEMYESKRRPTIVNGVKMKQVWVRKDMLPLLKAKGPKKVWVPRTYP